MYRVLPEDAVALCRGGRFLVAMYGGENDVSFLHRPGILSFVLDSFTVLMEQ
jgi:hypothetical protein